MSMVHLYVLLGEVPIQILCPVDEWIKKLWCIYMLVYYTAEKKKESLPFSTAWMELETIIISEINQLMKDKYNMTSFL